MRFYEYTLADLKIVFPKSWPPHCRPRIVAALLPLALCVGCQQPLAVQNKFFAPDRGTARAVSAEVTDLLRYNQALAAARRECLARPTAPGERDPATAAARAALNRLCATESRPALQTHGGISNAYRRWVEDEVRELPKASATAAGAAGGGS